MVRGTYNPVSFAQGRSRTAHMGVITAPLESRGTKVVIKKPKDESYANLLGRLEEDVQVARKAQEFAVRFNLASRTATPINFQQPVKVSTDAGEPLLAEYYLYGEYTKWISNGGYVDHWKTAGNEILLAFAHWTWVNSSGQYLVCDLQGVKGNPDGYHLTDPAIHSQSQEYGATDLGKWGVELFFETHVCNSECWSLGIQNNKPLAIIPNLQALLSSIGNQLGTTYQGELHQLLQSHGALATATGWMGAPFGTSFSPAVPDSGNMYRLANPSGLFGMKTTYRY